MDIEYDYDKAGLKYSSYRRTEPSIAGLIHAALGAAKIVLNVGAGTGSYEPEDRYVIAVEPSAAQRAQRPSHLSPAINARAESLPFDDNAFDASMASLTIHHWKDPEAGLREMRRVTKGPVVIFTYDATAVPNYWFSDYAPEIAESDAKRFPTIEFVTEVLGGTCEVKRIPVPFNCIDGFHEAFYGRPEAFLDPQRRRAQSAWDFLPEGVEERIVRDLTHDLETGEWDRRYGHLRSQPEYTCALRLIIAYR
jgi:SAM-dependent methyltransferase